ncbi:MAG TPA: hypothetical protein VL133_13680 [Devosia sp.]|nr:hypothetical protein [Devosia sp.]
MTRDDLDSALRPLVAQLDRLDARVSVLPDKAAIYTAAFAVHAMIWATIGGTVAMLKAFGAF